MSGRDCRAQATLAHEARDVATIQGLEAAWNKAFLIADTEFEACRGGRGRSQARAISKRSLSAMRRCIA